MSAPPALPERPGASPTHMNIDRELLKLMRPGRIGGNRRWVGVFFRECWCACPTYERVQGGLAVFLFISDFYVE